MDVATDYETHDLFDPGTLHELRTVEDSKSINNPKSPCIIISASGMATGGRVVHHLEMMLPNPKHTVLMVGYQAVGTRGRALVSGEKSLKMYGQYVPVRMEVVQVGSFSVHADRKEMLDWMKTSDAKPKVVYVVHGEEEAAKTFASEVTDELNLVAVVPQDLEHVLL
jgi:metallo-beta-lactamase family protein